MKLKAIIVIISYSISDPQEANINFVNFLLRKYPDTSVEIDVDAEWDLFINQQK